jgi:3-deoxy-manno-octulosonate cytidylyltransferase (CMP-KDO synthetase)
MPSVTAIIPARYASTRLPGKPLVQLAGKPMVQHVYECAAKARSVNRVIVATDDERIATVIHSIGGDAMMTPSDVRSGSDRAALVAKLLPASSIVVNVQGDEPLLLPDMIDEAVGPLLKDPTIQAGTLVKGTSLDDEIMNPSVVKVVLNARGFAMYFSRSPIPHLRDGTVHGNHRFYKHIGLYVFRREFLLEFASWPESPLERAERLEQLRILEHGYHIKATITEHDSIPIDTEADVERVERILQAQIGHRRGVGP